MKASVLSEEKLSCENVQARTSTGAAVVLLVKGLFVVFKYVVS